MPELSPDHALILRDVAYLPELQNEHQITTRVLSAIPVDQSDYRPNDVSRPALELAWHMVATEIGFMTAVVEGKFGAFPTRTADVTDSAALVRYYEKEFSRCTAQLGTLSGQHLATPIDFVGLFNFPAVVYLSFANSHSIHHRGQLSTYLRPMGAKVPAMYGDSHDSAQARASA